MPTYQYSCTACGHFFEQFQSFSEDSLTVCPACEGQLRKVFNAVGVVFKGSGFYRTDSRSGSSAGAGASKAGGEPVKAGATSTSAGGSDGANKAAATGSGGSGAGSSSSSGESAA